MSSYSPWKYSFSSLKNNGALDLMIFTYTFCLNSFEKEQWSDVKNEPLFIRIAKKIFSCNEWTSEGMVVDYLRSEPAYVLGCNQNTERQRGRGIERERLLWDIKTMLIVPLWNSAYPICIQFCETWKPQELFLINFDFYKCVKIYKLICKKEKDVYTSIHFPWTLTAYDMK